MNLSSLLSAPASLGSLSGGTAAGHASGSSSGAFDALVTAKAGVADGSAQSPAASETVASESAEPAPTESSALSAATLAMLAALDRSATMLSQPQGATPVAGAATGKDDRPVAPDPATPADAGAAVPAALIAAFMTVGRALPAVVSDPQEEPSDASAVTTSTSSAPKETPLLTTAAPMPALFTAIAAELRPVLAAKADLASLGGEAAPETAKDAPDSLSTISPTSAMIRDLASTIANSVTPSAPADGVAVDRHLDLARGDAWLNDLANDIAATAANGGRLKFGLAPESLGRLDVEIRQGQAGVSVHMTTRTDTARDLLTAAQPRIVDEIRAQGVRVAGTEVSTDASGFGGDRAGNGPRQPLGLPIDVALSMPAAALSAASASVADGRYA